ncbi:hypothetical protein CQW23_09426 [Capsicum baccatum]|uniref:Retrovirus-related Pol polyprotein from transposon TNT 1-94-like beta-barrel domain-containing protein n=1 Tax=Capsicum baccatum TaxID=33114 RepID=A0A2G2WWY5_CAPBA|nr:hypothetical protein CQW23_09426 [Capsicum baccatum]
MNCRAPKKGKKKDLTNLLEFKKEMDDLCAMHFECNLVGNSREWLMDSGDTRHVCANKELFSTFAPTQVEEKIYMENSSTTKVEGTGKVCLKMTSGKVLTLNNVFQVVIGRAGNMMYNGKSLHIRWRNNTVKELISSGIITVDYVKSKDNVLGPLTKDLSRERVGRTSKRMGLRPRTSQHGGLRVVVPRMRGWKTSLAYTPVGNGNDWATSIHIAANEGHLNMIRELSFHRPDSLEMLNNNGQNALHVVISNYKTRVVRFLLKSKESHNLIDSQIMMAILLSICLLPLTK